MNDKENIVKERQKISSKVENFKFLKSLPANLEAYSKPYPFYVVFPFSKDNLSVFCRKRHGGDNMIRSANYEPCILARETQRFLDKRLNNVDMEVTAPSEILPNRPAYFRSFPILEKSVLKFSEFQESTSR